MGQRRPDFSGNPFERVHFVTRNYQGLQGLRILPWVPVLLLWGGSESGLLRGAWWLWAFLAAVVGALGATLALTRWYRRTYGTVARRWDRSRRRLVGLAIAGIALVWVVMFAAGVTGWWPPRRWPALEVVSLQGVLLGLAFGIMAWPGRHVTAHHLHAALALLGLSLLPLGLLPAFGGMHPFGTDGAIWMVLGVYATIVGIADHRVLVATLGPPRGGVEAAP